MMQINSTNTTDKTGIIDYIDGKLERLLRTDTTGTWYEIAVDNARQGKYQDKDSVIYSEYGIDPYEIKISKDRLQQLNTTASPRISFSSGPYKEGDTVTITVTDYDSTFTYTHSASIGTLTDNSDGTYTWVLPEVTANTRASFSLVAEDKNGGMDPSSPRVSTITVMNAITPDPVLTISNCPVTGPGDVTVVIDNYSNIKYDVNVSLGTFTRTNKTILWSVPEVPKTITASISVQGTKKDDEPSAIVTEHCQIKAVLGYLAVDSTSVHATSGGEYALAM